MKKNIVTIYSLHWDAEYLSKRERWFVDRKEAFSYQTNRNGESAAEHAFHITNASEDYLTEEDQLIITNNFSHSTLPSVKTGDIIKVESIIRGTNLPDYYLCKPHGWEKFDGDRIQLIRHLLW
jgi:hypothetical protein